MSELCKKCGATSGNDWNQCKGSCPQKGSPHYKDPSVMDLSGISKVLAEAALLPKGNLNGMKISMPGVLSHGHRTLTEMLVPFDDAPGHIVEQFEDRLTELQPGLHAHGLELLGSHLALLKKAFQEGDAKTVRQFFDLYVFD